MHFTTNENGDKSLDESSLIYDRAKVVSTTPRTDVLLMLIVSIVLAWPWVLVLVVWSQRGVVATPNLAAFVGARPQTVTFITTLSGTLLSAIMASLFSKAIMRFSQKWILRRQEVDVFHVSFFMTLRYQFFPWGVRDVPVLAKRWYLVITVAACIFVFNFVPSTISALLNPTVFNKTELLTGVELDFANNASDCEAWFNLFQNQDNCGWQIYPGFEYDTCANDTLDGLESGRSGILSALSNGTQIQRFRQLGGVDGINVLGNLQGVLPIGPNGIYAIDTLSPSGLSNPNAIKQFRSYQYTLELQGLHREVKCSYDNYHPMDLIGDVIVGFCLVGKDIIQNNTQVGYGHHPLLFWPCGLGELDASGVSFKSYALHIHEYTYYPRPFVNVTCTLSSAQPAIIPVTFTTQFGAFSIGQPISLSETFTIDLVERSVIGLATLMNSAMTNERDLVETFIVTIGESHGLSTDDRSEPWLRLFEALIQGVIEYQATNTRMIYAARHHFDLPAPRSCLRTVNGNTTYEAIGWFYSKKTIAFLLPATIINLTTLVLLLATLRIKNNVDGLPKIDVTDPRSLLLANAPLNRTGDNVRISFAGDLTSNPYDPESVPVMNHDSRI